MITKVAVVIHACRAITDRDKTVVLHDEKIHGIDDVTHAYNFYQATT